MQARWLSFVLELWGALIRLVAYFALLAGMGYGGLALMNGALVNVFAVADQSLEWIKPKAPVNAGERFHPSLPPKLRGAIEEVGLR